MEKIVVLDSEQIGTLKMLIMKEQQSLMDADKRNETMIEEFREILIRLRQARRVD